MRVAGVATNEALMALRVLQKEQGLPTLSKAVGAALEEWREARKRRVLNPETSSERSDPAEAVRRGSTSLKSQGA